MLRHEVHVGWRRPDIVDAFDALVTSGTLEKFRGTADDDAVAQLDTLSADLQRIASAPTLDLAPWMPRQ